LLFNLPGPPTAILFVSLLIGTPAVSAVGAIGASLTLSLQKRRADPAPDHPAAAGPAVIFGAGAGIIALDGLGARDALGLLAAFAFAAVLLSPFAAAASVRLNLGG